MTKVSTTQQEQKPPEPTPKAAPPRLAESPELRDFPGFRLADLAAFEQFIRIPVSAQGVQKWVCAGASGDSQHLLFYVLFPEHEFMAVRGVRGATTVESDDPALIRAAARELMEELLRRNQISDFDDVISAVFTTTEDLCSAFPAEAARAMGMSQVPLLCAQEIPVPGSMPRCIRVLLHINSARTPKEIEHVYLRDAQKLRPDLKSAQ